MEVLIDSSVKIIDPLRAGTAVTDGFLTMDFEENQSYRLSKILVLARKEEILWSRNLTEEEKNSFQVKENFHTFVCECRNRFNYNYSVAVEVVYENGQKAIAFIVDPKRAKAAIKKKNGSFDRRKAVCEPIVMTDVERLDGAAFEALVVMLFPSDKSNELLIRLAVPKQIADSIIRGNTEKIKISGGKLKLELTTPVLDEEISNVIFCNVRDDIRYEMDYTVEKQQKQWIIKASIDLDQVSIIRPFWAVFAVTELAGFEVLVPFSISSKLFKKIRAFGHHGILKSGEICFTMPSKKKTLQFLIRDRVKYDSYFTKFKEAIAIFAYLVNRKKVKGKQTWLIFEKFCSMAQDNGVAFFRYCMDNVPASEKKHIYYIIEKGAPGSENLKQYGRNVVKFMSIKHMYLCLAAQMIVASESKRHLYPWRGKPSFIESKIRKKPIFFLQHGVTAFKRVDRIFGKSGTDPMTYFVATSKQEQDIVTGNFGYRKENVPILGFARWDLLEDKSSGEENLILVMPTWRNWLQDMDSAEFKESKYFKHYSALLEDDKLNEMMHEHNARIVFYIHPKFKEYAQDFGADNDRVSIIPFGAEPLNELMMKSKLLITDYSSVAWDFYYMKKPVVFYQFDYDEYILKHSSYIDMTKQLFGDRVVDSKSIIECVCSYIESGFEEKPDFCSMRGQMFQYTDRDNCKRTYNFIRNINKKKSKTQIISSYMNHYNNDPIDETLVLLESQNGKKIDGSIYYILQELLSNEVYDKYRICVSAQDEEARDLTLRKIGHHDRVQVVVTESAEYYEVLATAKYLINDATFRNTFIKKDGQKYLNLWHGTPLKNMGRKAESDPDESGNVTKNFICADYLLYPNEYTRQHMAEDYMIENLSKATILYCGYPRNTAFFDDALAKSIREKKELTDKRVYVYMPTWRKNAGDAFQILLTEIDQKLSEGEVMYAKMHPLADSGINYSGMKHVRKFPDEYETYEFLNVADCLITDYSSVMFDFAVSGKKTVLFTFDEEEYLKERGMYLTLDELPFERVEQVDDLLARIREDDTEDQLAQFREKFCAYDSSDSVKRLCEKFFFETDQGIREEQLRSNGRENVFVFAGNISDPGVEQKVMPYLTELEKTGKNIFLTYKRKDVIRKAGVLHRLPAGIGHFGMPGAMNLTSQQRSAKKKYEKGELSFEKFWQVCRDAYECELKRNHGSVKIDKVILYDNLDEKMLLEYSVVDCTRILLLGEEKSKELENCKSDYQKYIKSHYTIKHI